MILAIDGTQAILSPFRGVGRYTKNLITSLVHNKSGLDVIVFYNSIRKVSGKQFFNRDANAKIHSSHLPGRILNGWWKNLSFPSIDFFTGPHEIFHAPSIHLIPPTKGRLVCTIHDLVPIKFPENYTKAYLIEYKHRLEIIRKRSDAIITVSESTKNDLLSCINYSPRNIYVIPEASTLDHMPDINPLQEKLVLNKYGLDSPYILYVGGGEPHKNVPGIIKAFSQVKTESRIPHKLVLVGNILGTSVGLRDLITKYNLEKEIIFTGIIPDKYLSVIYKKASIFLFLSLYEGFGLSLLEAMKYGLPIVASNTSSIPEVLGDSGILVDPTNIIDIKDSIVRIINDQHTSTNLKNHAISRSSQFTWENTASQVLKVYNKLLS